MSSSSPRNSIGVLRSKTSVTIKSKEPIYTSVPRPHPRARLPTSVSNESEGKTLARPIPLPRSKTLSAKTGLAKSTVTVKQSSSQAISGSPKVARKSRIIYPKPPPPPKIVKSSEKGTTAGTVTRYLVPNGVINALHAKSDSKTRSPSNSPSLRPKSAAGVRERKPAVIAPPSSSNLSVNAIVRELR